MVLGASGIEVLNLVASLIAAAGASVSGLVVVRMQGKQSASFRSQDLAVTLKNRQLDALADAMNALSTSAFLVAELVHHLEAAGPVNSGPALQDRVEAIHNHLEMALARRLFVVDDLARALIEAAWEAVNVATVQRFDDGLADDHAWIAASREIDNAINRLGMIYRSAFEALPLG